MVFVLTAEDGGVTAAGWRCPQNLKFENSASSFDRLRERNLLKCPPHVKGDYFSSFIQSYHCLVALMLQSSFVKLPTLTNDD